MPTPKLDLDNIWLLGQPLPTLTCETMKIENQMLPSKSHVLRRVMHLHRIEKHSSWSARKITTDEVLAIWAENNIPTSTRKHYIETKVLKLMEEYRNNAKSRYRDTFTYRRHHADYKNSLEQIFEVGVRNAAPPAINPHKIKEGSESDNTDNKALCSISNVQDQFQ